jgi:hypothetical protein
MQTTSNFLKGLKLGRLCGLSRSEPQHEGWRALAHPGRVCRFHLSAAAPTLVVQSGIQVQSTTGRRRENLVETCRHLLQVSIHNVDEFLRSLRLL